MPRFSPDLSVGDDVLDWCSRQLWCGSIRWQINEDSQVSAACMRIQVPCTAGKILHLGITPSSPPPTQLIGWVSSCGPQPLLKMSRHVKKKPVPPAVQPIATSLKTFSELPRFCRSSLQASWLENVPLCMYITSHCCQIVKISAQLYFHCCYVCLFLLIWTDHLLTLDGKCPWATETSDKKTVHRQE
jgi:hypothetical protein